MPGVAKRRTQAVVAVQDMAATRRHHVQAVARVIEHLARAMAEHGVDAFGEAFADVFLGGRLAPGGTSKS